MMRSTPIIYIPLDHARLRNNFFGAVQNSNEFRIIKLSPSMQIKLHKDFLFAVAWPSL
jgi:hypothetical protein